MSEAQTMSTGHRQGTGPGELINDNNHKTCFGLSSPSCMFVCPPPLLCVGRSWSTNCHSISFPTIRWPVVGSMWFSGLIGSRVKSTSASTIQFRTYNWNTIIIEVSTGSLFWPEKCSKCSIILLLFAVMLANIHNNSSLNYWRGWR